MAKTGVPADPPSPGRPVRSWLGGRGRSPRGPEERPAAVDPEMLPPVHAGIELHLPDGGVLSSRVMGREPRSGEAPVDYLDAPRSAGGGTVVGWALLGARVELQWGHDEWVDAYPVEVREVLEPLPALEVRYLGPPHRRNRRHELRAAAHVRVRLTRVDARGLLGRGFASITRDISPSGARAFTPEALAEGDVLQAEFALDEEPPLAGTLSVIRCGSEPTGYRGYDGWDAVLRWDPPLEGSDMARWVLFCRRHRWDY